MVLFNPIIQVATLPDPDRRQLALGSVLQSVRRIARQDRLSVGLATIDDNPLAPAMPLECLAQKPFGSRQIAPLAKPELNGVTVTVNRA
jgi:hypothetical protein